MFLLFSVAPADCVNTQASVAADCDYWAAAGECDINPVYMSTYCKESCRACDQLTPEFSGRISERFLV